jgi:hypothetical protein
LLLCFELEGVDVTMLGLVGFELGCLAGRRGVCVTVLGLIGYH